MYNLSVLNDRIENMASMAGVVCKALECRRNNATKRVLNHSPSVQQIPSNTWTTQWPWNHEPVPACFHISMWKHCRLPCHHVKAGSPQPIIQTFYSGQIDWFTLMQQIDERKEKINNDKTLQANPWWPVQFIQIRCEPQQKCSAASGLLFPSVRTFCFLYTVHMLSNKMVRAILWTALRGGV